MNTPVSRRKMLKLMAALAGGVGLVSVQRLLTTAASQSPTTTAGMTPQVYLPLVARPEATATPTATHTPTPTPTRTPTSTPTRTPTPGATPPLQGRVVHTHSTSATSWTGQADYWSHVSQTTVSNMVDQGLKTLTGQATVANAWGVLLPNYQTGQGIAVKVSFNNSQDFTGGAAIDAVIAPVNALISGLKARGVAESDIWIYDAIRVLPDRFVNNCPYSNVRFFCKTTDPSRPRLELATFDSTQPSAQVTFNPPAGVPSPSTIRVSDVIVNATYLINMPIMKVHSFGTTGVSLGFKNHWGTIDHPSNVHDWIMLDGAYRRSDYNGLLDVYRNPNIRPKTVLTLADGLFGSVNGYSVPPVMWSTFGNKPPNSLFFAADPVAMDCVLCDFVKAEAGEMDNTDSYLQLAHGAGLGVYERGNPWSTGTKYSVINYTTIEL